MKIWDIVLGFMDSQVVLTAGEHAPGIEAFGFTLRRTQPTNKGKLLPDCRENKVNRKSVS